MTHPHEGHILTSKLKKSLEISMHLGGKDIKFGFGGGGKKYSFCVKYTPLKKIEIFSNIFIHICEKCQIAKNESH